MINTYRIWQLSMQGFLRNKMLCTCSSNGLFCCTMFKVVRHFGITDKVTKIYKLGKGIYHDHSSKTEGLISSVVIR